MIKILPYILLIFITNLWAQFDVYYPNGKKIEIKFETIGQLLDSLGIKESDSHSNDYGVAYYKRLTNKPIFILFLEKPNISKIKDIISAYDYKKYLYSYSYYYDLKDMIKEGSLTKDYLFDAFGKPDEIQREAKKETLIFKNYNAKIIFENDVAKTADVINYKALDKNKFAIISYDVTGSDYTIGFDISLLNLSDKTIKYTFITVTATNPVNDKIGTKTVKAIGPIKSNETGSYEFEDTFYSNTAQYLGIDKIKIQYMDGTTRNISKSEIKNITIENWEEVGNRVVY